jgi:intein-encoded DNA endonuclease-like protein
MKNLINQLLIALSLRPTRTIRVSRTTYLMYYKNGSTKSKFNVYE